MATSPDPAPAQKHDQPGVDARSVAYDHAEKIVMDEAKHLHAWRGRLPRVGLALSGGGIRSATYNLGVLQALAHEGMLPEVDYLSTVSGGGYIGTSLTYLLHRSANDDKAPEFDVSKRNFPYVSYPMVGVGGEGGEKPANPDGDKSETPESERQKKAQAEKVYITGQRLRGRLLRRLRQSTNYLVPGDGITVLSLAGIITRNLAASLAAHVALLLLLFHWIFGATTALPPPAEAAAAKVQTTQAQAQVVSTTMSPATATSPAGTTTSSTFTTTRTTTEDSQAPAKKPVYPEINRYLQGASWVLLAWAVLSSFHLLGTWFFDTGGTGMTSRLMPYAVRRGYEQVTHWMWLVAIALALTGGIPWVHAFLASNEVLPMLAAWWSDSPGTGAGTGIVATLVGLLGNLWGYFQSRSTKKPLVPTGLVVALASAALLFGLLLLVYSAHTQLHTDPVENLSWKIFGWTALALFFLGWVPQVNYISLHRFYRDRLLELFLPDLGKLQDQLDREAAHLPLHLYLWNRLKGLLGTGHIQGAIYSRLGMSLPGDTTMLANVCHPGTRAQPDAKQGASLDHGPYHLINANLVLVASQNPRFRPRGADNFIFSPLYCGSRATGWYGTNKDEKQGYTLATAMAISGAAINPNAAPGGHGLTRQPGLSVLMGLLNLRLGYWIRHPAKVLSDSWHRHLLKPNALYPGMLESFGRFNLHEHARYLLLTDGGHFENLGLYELVRRRLKLIIVCDATADPDFKFTDLANAIQKVRADFGAIIDLDAQALATLVPAAVGDGSAQGKDSGKDGKDGAPSGAAKAGYLAVPIRYARRLWNDQDPGATEGAKDVDMPNPPDSHGHDETGTLVLLKATFFEGLPADLYSYRRDHPAFPNQDTVDQFFDERQFDAYRELGFFTAQQMVRNLMRSLMSNEGDAVGG